MNGLLMHYHAPSDHTFSKQLRTGAPEAFKAFIEFDQVAFAEGENRLAVKTRELIAIGVAATTQCPYCMEAHVAGAKKAGATQAEVAEAIMVASALRAGAAFTHGWMAMKFFDKD
ncbi:carboxymuconolactone decarboxylase family protein [Candidatus Aalborgicola defluviihabitans]|jgi:AhpD family alkylhydroperoxidase|uniref:carboxymuconolactone decarboxylase family protein n=1 Tax=Candidatus Aalborgicola defluviihabitans TaxID=3386187 RepID=UPI0039B82BFB